MNTLGHAENLPNPKSNPAPPNLTQMNAKKKRGAGLNEGPDAYIIITMRAERLDLKHKELLQGRLRGVDSGISEYSFANLYLFRRNHEYEVLLDDDVFIRGRSYDGHTYVMPTRDVEEIDVGYLKALLRDVDFLFPVPEKSIGVFDPGEFSLSFEEGEMDYVYLTEKMSTYPGRKLHSKKNLLNYFISHYSHEALPLTRDRMEDALAVLDRWQDTQSRKMGTADYVPCHEALMLYDELVLCGGIYYAEGEPAGFIIGEEVNDETFVLHFAKARTDFKGIYQYMFANFAGVLPQKYRYMNFEPDLDIEALRFAKESYQPEMKLKKYRVALRG